MSKRNLRSLERLADEEQELYTNIRRGRIRKQNEVRRSDAVTKNQICDKSDNSEDSHCKNLPDNIKFKLEEENKQTFLVKNVVSKKLDLIMNKPLYLKEKLTEVEKVQVGNSTERAQKEVFRFISFDSFFLSLNQHTNKPNLFSSSNIKMYSEEDFKLKFWSYILEEIFGYGNITLKWGDTVPGSLSKSNIVSKMDLRVSATSAPLDLSMTEFAKECTSPQVGITIKTSPEFTPEECTMYPFGIRPKQYMVVNVATFSYPATKSQVNEGGIEKLVNALSYIKSSASGMKAKIDDARTKRHISKIDDLVGTSTVADTEEWETKVIWPDMSVLEDSRDWDDNSEDAEENIHDEEDDEE
ncbi:hypothetical protein MFLAVUS_009502 [Mucor flavus]|uniref:Uncharacterized protein n=1 Tax=Mucor flavus TaxID=439312 RepID=A0ABP9ZA25_9FUNG